MSSDLSFGLTPQNSLFDYYNDTESDPVETLTRAWMNERNAPELLPYMKNIIDALIEQIEEQTAFVMDEMSSSIENKFISMLYQTEVERVRYLIKSYLRTRLFKIEKYTLELLRKPDMDSLMSPQEIVYARRYQELVEVHNHESFLSHLPVAQHRQDETVGDLKMVVSANLEAPVFCQVLENIGEINWEINNRMETTELEKGEIYIIRYRAIKTYLEQGRIRLI
ncbi:hypothetical protein BJ944DRAFT_266449 [Cunninghamella echinulata]|nr:hypothetical protein BJ944DRAFT_266449 [Cunninghamella echinulata]